MQKNSLIYNEEMNILISKTSSLSLSLFKNRDASAGAYLILTQW